MKNITITSLLCLWLFSPKLLAQEEMQISKNAVELDLFSFNRLYNLNYGRAFVKNNWAIIPKVGIYLFRPIKVGYSNRQFTDGYADPIFIKSSNAVNAGVDFLYGKRKHFLQLGVNSMVAREFLLKWDSNEGLDKVLNYAIQSSIGYRYQKNKKGFYFTAVLRPFTIRIDAQRNESGGIKRVYNFDFRDFPLTFFPSPGVGYSF